MKTYILFALLGILPLHAASLGDAIDASKEAAVQEQALGTTEVSHVQCTALEASLCSALVLPDAMGRRKTISSPQEGQLVLFVRGKFLNRGAEKIDMELPKFCSADEKMYDGKALYYKGVKPKGPFIFINPDEEYSFVVYYFLPPTAVIGGKLLFTDNKLISKARGEVDLHFDRSTAVEDKLTKEGITDNPFDAMD